MHNPPQESAMTEIALALAMGFFSIMVLTMISMGVDGQTSTPSQTAVLTPAVSQDERSGAATLTPEDRIVIYDGERFLDTDLVPLNPDTLTEPVAGSGHRIVLAVDPSLPLEQAMAARAQITESSVVVSTLDKVWLKALSRSEGTRP